MYQRWMERHGLKFEINDIQVGDEAGIKSATLRVSGENAYGLLQTERGVHRLVRISPFDSNKRRHTSFASVDAVPEIRTFRSRSTRPTSSATHSAPGAREGRTSTRSRPPSGSAISRPASSSPARPSATRAGMARWPCRWLKAKLYQMEADKKRAEADRQYSEKGDVAWGNQIRSYVFQPYQMVKDLRTGSETSDIQGSWTGTSMPSSRANSAASPTKREPRTTRSDQATDHPPIPPADRKLRPAGLDACVRAGNTGTFGGFMSNRSRNNWAANFFLGLLLVCLGAYLFASLADVFAG